MIYIRVGLPSGSTENSQQLQSMLGAALPDLYAAVIIFIVKAHSYFEARGKRRNVLNYAKRLRV